MSNLIEYKVYYHPKKIGSTFKLYFVEAENKEQAIKKAEKKISGTIFGAYEVYNPFRKKKWNAKDVTYVKN